MLPSRLYYLNLSDRFSCATAQLIGGHPSIKLPILKHTKTSGQNGSKSQLIGGHPSIKLLILKGDISRFFIFHCKFLLYVGFNVFIKNPDHFTKCSVIK